MNTTTPSKFSEYQRLRLSNPTAYYRTKTQHDMRSACEYHGNKFFDLNEAGNTLFCEMPE